MRFEALRHALDRGTPCVWVEVAGVRGSAPREPGAGMLVMRESVVGTVGGGHLEFKAIELAREWLRLGQAGATRRHYPLGPALGQCCGGAVDLLFRPVTAPERGWIEALADAEQTGGEVVLSTRVDAGAPHTAVASGTMPCTSRHLFDPWRVWVFGAGHVGRALAQVLGTLSCELTWVDSRDAEFPAQRPDHVQVLLSDQPQDEVDDIPPGADVLVLTHSHALDLEIVACLMRRGDLGQVGMIGSATKAALFRRRLADRGFDAACIARLVCPIGSPRLKDKHPGAIAVNVAMDLLSRRQAMRREAGRAVETGSRTR